MLMGNFLEIKKKNESLHSVKIENRKIPQLKNCHTNRKVSMHS